MQTQIRFFGAFVLAAITLSNLSTLGQVEPKAPPGSDRTGAAARKPPTPPTGAPGVGRPDLPGYRLLFEQTFETGSALEGFAVTDPKAWALSAGKKEGESAAGNALELTRQSDYQPKVRSPVNIALIADRLFGDFILEADLVQTGREYGHRDMCIFFGFTNPENFYYVHVASAADDHAHNVFIVKDAPRTKIATKTTRGVDWGLEVWHKARIERNTSTGMIRVLFDGQQIMEAEDKNFTEGYIGFGSFDDTGKVDNIRIWGPSAKETPAPFFQRPK